MTLAERLKKVADELHHTDAIDIISDRTGENLYALLQEAVEALVRPEVASVMEGHKLAKRIADIGDVSMGKDPTLTHRYEFDENGT